MLQNCTLRSFKSVHQRITLPLAPLTVFAGPNSSGKSTVIQSLLLTAQTLQNPVGSRSVVLNGHILKLGEFDDILSQGAPENGIELGFSLSVPTGTGFGRHTTYLGHSAGVESVECFFSFSGQSGLGDLSGLRKLQPRLDVVSLRVRARTEEAQEVSLTVKRSPMSVQERLAKLSVPEQAASVAELQSLAYEVQAPALLHSIQGYYPLPRSCRAAGASLHHFIPTRLSIVYDVVDSQEERILQILTAGGASEALYSDYRRPLDQFSALSPDIVDRLRPIILQIIEEYLTESGGGQRHPSLFTRSPRNRLEELSDGFSIENVIGFMRAMLTRDRRQLVARFAEREAEIRSAVRGHRPAEYDLAMVPLPPLLDAGVDVTTQFFSRYVKYLGPLRDEPKPVYPLASGADPKDIGYRGEHTAAVLETFRHSLVSYLPPHAEAGQKPEQTSLYAAVLDWLQYMGIAEEVRTQDLGKLGHELKVAAGIGETVHDLTHVGVGVSQVLPILVLALLADPGSTLIFEQPELHLHPRVQTRLADFFVSLSGIGKQCLVETHSEYLINRLRFKAAVSLDDSVSSRTLLYFVEREGGRSRYRPIRINEFGVIEEWPSGFFDESEELAASILRAGADKRRTRSTRADG